jgi:hypothetical protein
MTTSSRSRFSPLRAAALPGLLALGACNAIFGIEAGLPGGTAGTGGSTSSSSSSTACGADAGAPDGAPLELRISGAPGYDQGNAVTYDAKDDLIVAGYFEGSALTLDKALAHVGTPDAQNAFVIKYDPAGAYLWGQAFGGTKAVRLNAAGTDAAGNIYLTGANSGKATIGATTFDVAINPADPTVDSPDALVVALDPDGNVKWAKSFGNPSIQRGLRIAVDAAGNSYVAGVSYDKLDFGDGSGPLGDATGWWSFVVKLDPTGKTLWVQPFGAWDADLTPDYQEYFEIAVTLDSKGHAIVGGTFMGQTFFGDDLVDPISGADAFVASLDAATGKMLWHRSFHQPIGDMAPDGNQWITALTTDPCTGDIYAAGGFTEGIDFESKGGVKVSTGDPQAPDMFLVKLAASDGAPIWFHAYGDDGRQDATSVKAAPDGSVLLAGFLKSSAGEVGVDFGSKIGSLGPAEKGIGPSYPTDLFVVKLDAAGNGLWGKRRGDSSPQAAFDVALDSTGKIALTGITIGTLALGSGPLAFTSDTFDVYLARFDP